MKDAYKLNQAKTMQTNGRNIPQDPANNEYMLTSDTKKGIKDVPRDDIEDEDSDDDDDFAKP